MITPNPTPPRRCAPRDRCRDWRHCDHCARIRQARIATAAERLASVVGPLDWTTLQPASAAFAAIAEARAEFLRKTAPQGAIWTVEQSPNTGNLHLNLLTPAIDPPRLMKASAFHIRAIDNPRRVAAYIAKREQMPSRDAYDGRLYGTAGPLWQWLSAAGQQPIIQGAAIQHDIDADAGRLAPAGPELITDPIKQLSREDYRRIAERRLPDLLAAARR